MSLGYLGVVGCGFVGAGFVMLGGFLVMLGCLFVVFCSFLAMLLRSFLLHCFLVFRWCLCHLFLLDKKLNELLPLWRARIVSCGTISQYDGGLDRPDRGPRFLQHMLFQRATIQGILARDFVHRMDEMRATVGPWVKNREIVVEETFVDGFEQLPNALNMLFEGKNLGKLLVRV